MDSFKFRSFAQPSPRILAEGLNWQYYTQKEWSKTTYKKQAYELQTE